MPSRADMIREYYANQTPEQKAADAQAWEPVERAAEQAHRDAADKIRENRLRHMAERRGFLLRKSRRRDPMATDFGLYTLVSDSGGSRRRGATHGTYDLTLDDVENILNGTPEQD